MIHGGTDRLLTALPRQALVRMASAGATAVDCMATLHLAGSNIVAEVLRGHGEFTEFEHYPPADVHDSRSHSQYYFHAHSPEERDDPDYGHFHTFMRQSGMPTGISPAPVPDLAAPEDEGEYVCHLVAISMTPAGLPERLFTTNRWVTGDTWYSAQDVIAMLDGFVVESPTPSRSLNQWLTDMFVLFRPQIEHLLIARDRVIDDWQKTHLDTFVFEDRRLEITSSIEISLHTQIELLDRMLDACPDAGPAIEGPRPPKDNDRPRFAVDVQASPGDAP